MFNELCRAICLEVAFRRRMSHLNLDGTFKWVYRRDFVKYNW